jgi:hypothetical protein
MLIYNASYDFETTSVSVAAAVPLPGVYSSPGELLERSKMMF